MPSWKYSDIPTSKKNCTVKITKRKNTGCTTSFSNFSVSLSLEKPKTTQKLLGYFIFHLLVAIPSTALNIVEYYKISASVSQSSANVWCDIICLNISISLLMDTRKITVENKEAAFSLQAEFQALLEDCQDDEKSEQVCCQASPFCLFGLLSS